MFAIACGLPLAPRAWVLALIALLVAQTSELVAVDRLVGEYLHDGGNGDQRSVEAAIERAVELMLWPASEIARNRLRETNPIPRRLTIVRAGDSVTIAFDDRLRKTRLHARPISVIGLGGDELRYRIEVRGDALIQRFDGDGGGRLNTIRLEGDRLVVRVVIFSESLPVNVSYELRYVRPTSRR